VNKGIDGKIVEHMFQHDLVDGDGTAGVRSVASGTGLKEDSADQAP
jgi:hypothetical protein